MNCEWIFYRGGVQLWQVVHFVDDVKEGSFVRYYKNGNQYDEENFKAGKKVGEWKVYTEDGKLKK